VAAEGGWKGGGRRNWSSHPRGVQEEVAKVLHVVLGEHVFVQLVRFGVGELVVEDPHDAFLLLREEPQVLADLCAILGTQPTKRIGHDCRRRWKSSCREQSAS